MGLSGYYQTSGGQSHSVGIAVVPFLFIYFGFYDLSWTPLANMYSVEILPFHLRAKGQAIYNIFQGAGNAFNQWVNPIALDAIQWKYYSVYIVILTFYSIAIWFWFPETKGLTIEEISKIFDGEGSTSATVTAATLAKIQDHDQEGRHSQESVRSIFIDDSAKHDAEA